MPEGKADAEDESTGDRVAGGDKGVGSNVLRGTTLRVYRFLYKQGRPTGIRDLQRGLALSSSSVSLYHVKKLLEAGLIREQEGGYVVDRILFENMIRVRRSLIPFQTTYSIFAGATLITMLIFLRPPAVTPFYVFVLMVNSAMLGIFLFETIRTLRQTRL